jgi:hypothetical protein
MLETQSMIPDTVNRLRVAVEDLQMLIDDSSDAETSSIEFRAALEAIEFASVTLRDEA